MGWNWKMLKFSVIIGWNWLKWAEIGGNTMEYVEIRKNTNYLYSFIILPTSTKFNQILSISTNFNQFLSISTHHTKTNLISNPPQFLYQF